MNTLEAQAPTPVTTKKEEIPAHVLPLMDAARLKVLEAKMNPVEKSDRISDLLRAPAMQFSIHEDRKAERSALWAEYYAIKEREKESDLTNERRAYLLSLARKRLPDAERYIFAFELAKEIEDECLTDFTGPSRTLEALKSRANDFVVELTDYLSFSLSVDDIAFISSLNFTGRRRDRFRLIRTAGSGRKLLTDFGIRAPYVKMYFGRTVEHCATVRDVKRVCALWDTACTVERREGASVVTGEGFEIFPT